MKNYIVEQKISPINKELLNIIGSYLFILFLLCILVNTQLLIIFVRFKQLRTSLNKLIIVLTAFNLFGSIQFPFLIHSNFVHKYINNNNFLNLCYFIYNIYSNKLKMGME
jgi:hypothetical protein